MPAGGHLRSALIAISPSSQTYSDEERVSTVYVSTRQLQKWVAAGAPYKTGP